ncbi:MAG: DUF1517 domain-containing protein [Candidatus Tectomicrobia bacterium]|nr:DUF1517 domain-containing protein [Candidatus Tectomicrobia bacterium]
MKSIHKIESRGFFFLFLFIFLLSTAGEAFARSSGGRTGGSSGFSRSRSGGSGSSPSKPSGSPGRSGFGSSGRSTYSSPGYGGSSGYAGSSGGRGSYSVPVPVPVPTPSPWGYGYFSRPAYGFYSSGGGFSSFWIVLFGLIAIAVVLYVILSTLRRSSSDESSEAGETLKKGGLDLYSIVKFQLALLSTARFVQDELRNIALQGRTDTPEELVDRLRETTVLLARHPEYWRYGLWEVLRAGTLDEAESLFHETVSEERSKLSQELTVNVDGRVQQRALKKEEEEGIGEIGQYIVVTLILALSTRRFSTIEYPAHEDIERLLKKLGGIIPDHLLALEMMWVPENPDDTLSEEELLMEYPDLKNLSLGVPAEPSS